MGLVGVVFCLVCWGLFGSIVCLLGFLLVFLGLTPQRESFGGHVLNIFLLHFSKE